MGTTVDVSRGGRTTKIHCLEDGCGRLVAFAVTSGNLADVTLAIPFLTHAHVSRIRPKRLIADRAYYANSLRRGLKVRRIRAVIPSRTIRTRPFALDKKAYKRRNLIERFFARLKNWRRIATRYDRLARNHLAGLALISAVIAWT